MVLKQGFNRKLYVSKETAKYMSHVIPERRKNELFLSKKHAPAQISFKELSVHVYILILDTSLECCAQAVVCC